MITIDSLATLMTKCVTNGYSFKIFAIDENSVKYNIEVFNPHNDTITELKLNSKTNLINYNIPYPEDGVTEYINIQDVSELMAHIISKLEFSN